MKNFYKIIPLFFLLFSSFILFPQRASTADVLEVSVSKKEQSGYTYEIPIVVNIRSTVPSNRFELNIKVPQGFESDSDEYFTSIEANKNYEIVKMLKPSRKGQYKVIVEAQLWQADTNYKDIASIELNVNEDRELEPVSDSFKTGRRNYLILRSIGLFLLLLVITIFSIQLIKKFMAWVNS